MQQQNSYEKGVFNGDVGIVIDCDIQSKKITVEYDHGIVLYESKDLDQITLAYAISVHKSQGSEYPCVILPLTAHHYVMLQRNLLYTALTRGRKLVCLVGSKKAVAIAIRNTSTLQRRTGLQARLAKG